MSVVLAGDFSVHSLERTILRMGPEAEDFLCEPPQPPAAKEGEFLVATCDVKGVPLSRDDTSRVAAFETVKLRPGNRRMAVLGGV